MDNNDIQDDNSQVGNNPPANNPNNVDEVIISDTIKTRVSSKGKSDIDPTDNEVAQEPDKGLRADDIVPLDDPYYTLNLNRGNAGGLDDDDDDDNESTDLGGPNEPEGQVTEDSVAGEVEVGNAGHQGVDPD